jgi:phage-related protein
VAWEAIYYETPKGECPVRDFLDELPKAHRAKVFAAIALLQDRGPALGFPYTSQVEGKMRELRTHYGRQLYRILYFMDNRRRVVLLEAFEKDTVKVPLERLAVAASRLQDHLKREE